MADMIFLAKGTAKMGMCTRDGDGNIVTQTPATFTVEDTGSCIAVGTIDTETHQIKEPVSAIYGDWDAAGYLGAILQMINPSRTLNIPDFKSLIIEAFNNGFDICEHCDPAYFCRECVVAQWKAEAKKNGS